MTSAFELRDWLLRMIWAGIEFSLSLPHSDVRGGERSGVVIYQGRGMRLLRAFTRVKTCCS